MLKEIMKRTPPKGLTPQALKARRRFIRTICANLDRAKNISLNVLIWGPSLTSVGKSSKTKRVKRSTAPSAKVAQKRIEIRDRLIQLGFNAMFSEELPFVDGLSQKSIEFSQAVSADLIIVLIEGAPGALAEAHDFGNHPEIASKTLVMCPKEYRKGYSAKGALADLDSGYGGVYWYGRDAIRTCDVLGRAVQRAEARRQMRFRMETKGGR